MKLSLTTEGRLLNKKLNRKKIKKKKSENKPNAIQFGFITLLF